MHTPVQVESVHMDSVLRPVECFSEQVNSLVSADDIGASLNATEPLHAEQLADIQKAFPSLRCL